MIIILNGIFNTNFLKEFIKTKNIKTLLALIEAIDKDIIQLKIDNNKRIIIENPNLNLKPGDYINIIDEKQESTIHVKELLSIIENNNIENIINFNLFDEPIQMNLNGSLNMPKIKNFIIWLSKFIKNIKQYELPKINKSFKSFIKLYIKEVADKIIENTNLKVPDPKNSSEIIIKLFVKPDKLESPENISKNNIDIEEKKLDNIKMEVKKLDVNKLNVSKLNVKDSNVNNLDIKDLEDTKPLFKKAIDAYKRFSQIESIPQQNFIFFQIFNIPIFINISDILEQNMQKKVKRISFSFISNLFGLINTIIYEKNNSISLIFNIENNIDIFKENLDELLNSIKSEGIKIEVLQLHSLTDEIILNKKGLYG
ncbi:hypothetical protein [Marinitoga sp. 38H-ov]|uniref:hypothetical protein n=1 Tax=Marinitoga sp. 38H-ov TaxID=1755814 RepID=UPI0013EAD3EE|nr:hypothetical protein [Marinitoga sp. 38H-ov]KAF2955256.1 hypothetical protein AS160_01780 [Marinitoga sp. 38H-ov]